MNMIKFDISDGDKNVVAYVNRDYIVSVCYVEERQCTHVLTTLNSFDVVESPESILSRM